MISPEAEEPPVDGGSEIRALVAAAEEIIDPLEGLVERSKVDPGAPFQPDALIALSEQRQSNQPQFERTRAELRRAGVRVAKLDVAMARSHPLVADPSAMAAFSEGADLADMLGDYNFFCTPHGKLYADIFNNGHRETIPVQGDAFSDLLSRRYYEAFHAPPPADELHGALSLARARAKFDGPPRTVHVRLAAFDGNTYVDLGDPEWRAVEITPTGWSIIDEPPVRFIRPPGYLPLPEPQRGGSIEVLRSHLNLRDESSFVLVVAFILAALRPTGPYPLLVLAGQQGTAKSTATRLIKSLVDPSSAPLRSAPRSPHDLFIAAANGWMLAFDNLARVSSDLSNALCAVSTGGGFSARKLYTDGEESLFHATRAVILNGIDNVVTRPDLADRSLFVELERISDVDRLPESVLLERFARDQPLIMGALFDAVAHGLREVGNVKLERLPRMADFATLAVACEGAFWPAGTFMRAYENNRLAGIERLIERDVFASAIVNLMHRSTAYHGTASNLLKLLSQKEDDGTRRSRDWPQSHSQLSRRLHKLVASLQQIGIEVEWTREGHDRQRMIALRRGAGDPQSSIPDQTKYEELKRSDDNG